MLTKIKPTTRLRRRMIEKSCELMIKKGWIELDLNTGIFTIASAGENMIAVGLQSPDIAHAYKLVQYIVKSVWIPKEWLLYALWTYLVAPTDNEGYEDNIALWLRSRLNQIPNPDIIAQYGEIEEQPVIRQLGATTAALLTLWEHGFISFGDGANENTITLSYKAWEKVTLWVAEHGEDKQYKELVGRYGLQLAMIEVMETILNPPQPYAALQGTGRHMYGLEPES